jgi:methylthioribose-1-phosphate isomerase
VGTALAVLFAAKRKGMNFEVFVDETRPVLQGARLTCWELGRAGIEHTLICDNTAGFLMQQGRVDVVITGADRVCTNGDAANKIGTYSLAVLAAYHAIPFYIAAPLSTFDFSLDAGGRVPIEERCAEEVLCCGGKKTAPEHTRVYNPAFDVTPARLITAFVTEKGVIPPSRVRTLTP